MESRDLIRPENTPARPPAGHPPDGQLVWIPPGYELAVGQPPTAQEQESHLWDHIMVVWRRRWLVAFFFLVSLGLGVFTAKQAVPIYEGTAKLRIKPDTSQIMEFQDKNFRVSTNNDLTFIQTQVQVLTGWNLAEKVVEQLKLFDPNAPPDPADQPGKIQLLIAKVTGYLTFWKKDPNAGQQTTNPDGTATTAAMDVDASTTMQFRLLAFQSGLTVKPDPESEIISVSYDSTDPKEAAAVANAVCQNYIQWTYESEYASYDYARTWLKTKLDEMKTKLEQSEEELNKLAKGQEIMPADTNTDQYAQQLEASRQKVEEAKKVMFDKEQERKRYTSNANLSTLGALTDAKIQLVLTDYAAAKSDYEQQKLKLGPEHPDIKKLAIKKNQLEDQLNELRGNLLKRANDEYSQAKASYEYLQTAFDEERQRYEGIKEGLIKYNILKREVDANRELYNNLMQRWKEVSVASGAKPGTASIVEKALPPLFSSYPHRTKMVLQAVAIGLFLGFALAFFLEYMNTSVKGAEDLERLAHLPTLGFVPYAERRDIGRKSKVKIELITHMRPHSHFAESVRSLRTSVQYSINGRAPKTIMVTSCFPGEGKTTVATNLAIALAQRNKSVLLVDADLKKPSMHKLFQTDRLLGLTEVLTGKFDGDNVPETHITNLFVMPSGVKAPNPVELLDSDLMRAFITRVSGQYDHVIIDATPALNMADATVLAPYVDGVLLVVQPGKTPRGAVRRVRERILEVQGRVLGAALNCRRRVQGMNNEYSNYGAGGFGGAYGGYNRPYGTPYREEKPSRAGRNNHRDYVDVLVSPAEPVRASTGETRSTRDKA